MNESDDARPPIREQLADARYSVLAWSQSVAWLTALAGLGMVATGYAQRDATLFASGISVAVSAFLPRLKPMFAYEVARTLTMKWGWTPVPPSEVPCSPPDSRSRSSSSLPPAGPH